MTDVGPLVPNIGVSLPAAYETLCIVSTYNVCNCQHYCNNQHSVFSLCKAFNTNRQMACNCHTQSRNNHLANYFQRHAVRCIPYICILTPLPHIPLSYLGASWCYLTLQLHSAVLILILASVWLSWSLPESDRTDYC